MADLKISQLTGATTPLAGTEVLPIVQGGATKQVSVANLTAGRTQTSNGIVQDHAATGYNFTANTPAEGMTSQLLNWYEEGTWTPAIDSDTAGTGRATTVKSAKYTRIGNQVFVTCYVEMATLGTGGSGQIAITGLPFTASSASTYEATGTVMWYSLISPLYSMVCEIPASSTKIYLSGISTSSTSIQVPNFSSYVKAGSQFVISITYHTS